jgi:transcriptional regulator with XRE-family HTH domain
MKNIGEKLKEIRESKNFPQKQVAELLGLQRPNYSKIENNKQAISVAQLKVFCDFFDTSADYILDIKQKGNKVISKYEQDFILKYMDQVKDIIK